MQKSLLRRAVLGLAFGTSMAAQAAVPVQGYVVKQSFPHDEQAFTQGLFFMDGYLYESTGQYGASSVRKVDLSLELQILAYYEQRKAALAAVKGGRAMDLAAVVQ